MAVSVTLVRSIGAELQAKCMYLREEWFDFSVFFATGSGMKPRSLSLPGGHRWKQNKAAFSRSRVPNLEIFPFFSFENSWGAILFCLIRKSGTKLVWTVVKPSHGDSSLQLPPSA